MLQPESLEQFFKAAIMRFLVSCVDNCCCSFFAILVQTKTTDGWAHFVKIDSNIKQNCFNHSKYWYLSLHYFQWKYILDDKAKLCLNPGPWNQKFINTVQQNYKHLSPVANFSHSGYFVRVKTFTKWIGSHFVANFPNYSLNFFATV